VKTEASYGGLVTNLEKECKSRTTTWRIVLPLGRSGTNIPNVAFLDNEAGEADKIVAIDIAGSAWLLDIWTLGSPPVRWPHPSSRERHLPEYESPPPPLCHLRPPDVTQADY
jgi:hypothetical protein